VSVVLLNSGLSANFSPTGAVMIVGNRLLLDFELEVTGATLAQVEWYQEFTGDDPASASAEWYREVASKTVDGAVTMSELVRTFKTSAGANLGAGTHRLSLGFERLQRIARLQIRAAAGAVQAQITAPYGLETR
jgi:hypothetical protein